MKSLKVLLVSLMAMALLVGLGSGAALASDEKKVLLKVPAAFPSTLPTIGDGLLFFKDTVEKASGGSIAVIIYEPGKLMPPFEIHDSVSTGKVNAGYSVTGYIEGKVPSASLFSAVPFGPELSEYVGWFYFGNGNKLYQEMYDSNGYNIKAFPLTFMAPETAGWFKKPINKPQDLKGVKIRFFGLGGKVLSKLGASVATLPGGEIFPALEKGALDATEFSLPAIDTKLGFAKVAKYNYFPSWHQPATVLELLINKDTWNGMSENQQAVVEAAVKATNLFTIAQSVSQQGKVVKENETKFGTSNRVWSPEMLKLFKSTWNGVVEEEAAKDAFFKRVWEDLKQYVADNAPYGNRAYLPRSAE